MFTIGGLSGVMHASPPADLQQTDTYFIVAHFHYVLFGGSIFGIFAGIYHYFPKMTGRLCSEKLGSWNFWIMFIGFNLAFFPMHLVGLWGMPRRLYTYPDGLGWNTSNLLASVGAYMLGAGVAVSLINFFLSLSRGALAGRNPWGADTLEWSTESPPAPYGSVHIPTVATRHPLWDDHEEEHDPNNERILDEGRFTLRTTWLDAQPVALARMPEDTIAPLLLALALTVIFTSLVFKLVWIALFGIILSFGIAAYWFWPGGLEKAMEVRKRFAA